MKILNTKMALQSVSFYLFGVTVPLIFSPLCLPYAIQVHFDGFITFAHIDEHGKRRPHGIAIEISTPDDIELHGKARNL